VQPSRVEIQGGQRKTKKNGTDGANSMPKKRDRCEEDCRKKKAKERNKELARCLEKALTHPPTKIQGKKHVY